MSAPFRINSARAGAVAGFFAMAIVGWKFAEPAQNAVIASGHGEPASTKALKRQERNVSHGPPEYVRERLRVIRSAGSNGEKLRSTIDLANSLPIADLAAWLDHRWFDVGEGFDATLFKKIAMQRWIEEDPEGHAAWCMKNEGESEVINAWAKDDPQRVLAFFQKYPNRDFELMALQSMATNHPDIALARIKEIVTMGTSAQGGLDSYLLRAVLSEIGLKDPTALEAAMGTLPARWQKEVEGIFINQRLKSDFASEIRNLWQRPGGFSILQQADGEIRAKLIDELQNLPGSWKADIAANSYSFIDSDNAEKWLNADLAGSGFTTDQANSLKSYALQNLASGKPEFVIQQLATLNLDDAQRQNVISTLFGNSGNWKPEKTESLLAMLGSEEDRQFARTRLTAPPADPFAENPMTKIKGPSDWLEKASTIDPNNGSSYQLVSLLGGWDENKLAEVSRGFRSLPGEQKSRVAGLFVGDGYSSGEIPASLRGEAISYLIANPPVGPKTGSNDDTIHVASNHAVLWAQQDPAAASNWVQSLPAGDAKLWAQKNLAANWAQYDPDAAGQWVKSLPADARGEVEKFMKNSSSN